MFKYKIHTRVFAPAEKTEAVRGAGARASLSNWYKIPQSLGVVRDEYNGTREQMGNRRRGIMMNGIIGRASAGVACGAPRRSTMTIVCMSTSLAWRNGMGVGFFFFFYSVVTLLRCMLKFVIRYQRLSTGCRVPGTGYRVPRGKPNIFDITITTGTFDGGWIAGSKHEQYDDPTDHRPGRNPVTSNIHAHRIIWKLLSDIGGEIWKCWWENGWGLLATLSRGLLRSYLKCREMRRITRSRHNPSWMA